MKIILIKHYNHPWRNSGLDYQKEVRGAVSDETYLLFKNAAASVNSYEIVDIQINNELQKVSCKGRFRSYDHWFQEVHELVKYLQNSFHKNPNILVANEETFKLIDSIKARPKVKGLLGENLELKFCLDASLKLNEYRIVCEI